MVFPLEFPLELCDTQKSDLVSSLTCELSVLSEIREQVAPRFNACLWQMKSLGKWTE